MTDSIVLDLGDMRADDAQRLRRQLEPHHPEGVLLHGRNWCVVLCGPGCPYAGEAVEWRARAKAEEAAILGRFKR